MLKNVSAKKRILVTGGAGFLGSHLVERLILAGNDILCVDNYFTGRRDNLAHLADQPQRVLQRVHPGGAQAGQRDHRLL